MVHEVVNQVMGVSEGLLPFLLLVPLVAAVFVLFGAPARPVSVGAAALNLGLALCQCVTYEKPFSYTLFDVVPSLDLKFLVGLDGLSLMMVLLTTLVTLGAVWMTSKVESGENAFYASLLFISAGAMGAFISFDLFFFYAFHELALIPTFLLIGIWGHGDNRVAAAWKITIYLAVGSIVLLVGLIGLYGSLPVGQRTFDLVKLRELATTTSLIAPSAQRWIFPLLLAGFGILISLFPFHTWAPEAYAAAPTPAAMLHSGVLKKFGLYGLLRVAVPLLPAGMQAWTNVLLVLLIGNILFVGYVAVAQKRLDLLLGYSSVMHMGYIFLGIASLNIIGLTGASVMMFAHGLSIAVLFAVAGEVRARTGTMRLDELGGLAQPMPYLALIFGLAMFASIGLPGFANFASELMVFFGAFGAGSGAFGYEAAVAGKFNLYQIATVCGLWGVVVSAIYMLRAYRRVFLGPLRSTSADVAAAGHPVTDDLSGNRRWALALLMAGLVVVGFRPGLLVNALQPVLLRTLPANVSATTMLPASGVPAHPQAAVVAVVPPRG